MKRNHADNDQIEPRRKRGKEELLTSHGSVILLLDTSSDQSPSFESAPLTKFYNEKRRKELCNHTIAYLFSLSVFDSSLLENNFFDCIDEFPKDLVIQILDKFTELCSGEVKKLTMKHRNDRKVMLTAFKNYHFAFNFASRGLQNEREFAWSAVQVNSQCLHWVPKTFRSEFAEIVSNKPLVNTVNNCYSSQPWHSLVFRASTHFTITQETSLEDIQEYVRKDGLNLRLLNTDCSYDRNIVMEAIKSNGYALRFAASLFRNDKSTVLFALNQSFTKVENIVENIDCLGPDVINDRDIICQLLIGSAKRKFVVDWTKFDMKLIYNQTFLLEVYKALF